MSAMKEIYLERLEDETGVSGTGVVARGCILPSGRVVLEWQTFDTSINFYNCIDSAERVHGHHGKTKVVIGTPPEDKLHPPQPAAAPTKKKKKKNAGSPDK